MCDDELAELDFDLESLVRHEAGLLKPSAGELEPRHERRGGASARRVGAPAWRLLNRDAARGVSVVKCFKIGVSHDRLLIRVDVGQRVVWVAAHAARAAFTAVEGVAVLPLSVVLSL